MNRALVTLCMVLATILGLTLPLPNDPITLPPDHPHWTLTYCLPQPTEPTSDNPMRCRVIGGGEGETQTTQTRIRELVHDPVSGSYVLENHPSGSWVVWVVG